MKRKGFTLIETVIAMTVLSMGLFGTMKVFQDSVGTSLDSHLTVIASALAREQLEKMVFDKEMNGFDFIEMANYQATESFAGPFAPFTRTVAIQKVDGNDLTTARITSDYKRIMVTVTWTGGGFVRLETLVTRWGEIV